MRLCVDERVSIMCDGIYLPLPGFCITISTRAWFLSSSPLQRYADRKLGETEQLPWPIGSSPARFRLSQVNVRGIAIPLHYLGLFVRPSLRKRRSNNVSINNTYSLHSLLIAIFQKLKCSKMVAIFTIGMGCAINSTSYKEFSVKTLEDQQKSLLHLLD